MKKWISIFLILSLLAGACLFALPAGASDSVLIDFGSKWQYVVYEEDPELGLVQEEPAGWLDGTDTEEWKTGTAPIGGPMWGSPATSLPYQYFSGFFKKTFEVKDLSKITSLTMYIKYDENPTVYLNGVMIWTASGYIDSYYYEVELDDAIELLQEGENTLQVALSNVYGGAVFDAALICADAFDELVPIESEWEYMYGERVEPAPGEEYDVQFPAPDGWLDGTDGEFWDIGTAPFAGSAWPNWRTQTQFDVGSFDAYLRKTFTVEDVESITYLVLKVIYDEDPVIYLNGEEIWSASGYKDGGYQFIYINEQIPYLREGENIVCVYFRNKWGGGGSVFDMGLYYNRDEVEIEYYDDHGFIKPMSASSGGFVNFGDINKPGNVLDMSQNSVCGSAFNPEVEQYVQVEFRRPELVSEIYVQCKDEGTTENDDGTRGTYDIYLLRDGLETLAAADVPAVTGTDGGYTVELDTPTEADGVKVVITSWQGDCWACVADIAVTPAAQPVFERPDANRDGVVNLIDATYLLEMLEEPGADCDLNDDGATDIVDVTEVLTYLG